MAPYRRRSHVCSSIQLGRAESYHARVAAQRSHPVCLNTAKQSRRCLECYVDRFQYSPQLSEAARVAFSKRPREKKKLKGVGCLAGWSRVLACETLSHWIISRQASLTTTRKVPSSRIGERVISMSGSVIVSPGSGTQDVASRQVRARPHLLPRTSDAEAQQKPRSLSFGVSQNMGDKSCSKT